MLNQAHLDARTLAPTPNIICTKIARLITNLTAPPLLAIPSYLALAAYREARHPGEASLTPGLLIAIAFGCVAPVVIVVLLHLSRQISDIHIARREQRTLPFMLTLSCFVAGTLALWCVYGWGLLTVLLACYTLNTLVVMLVNFRWKISVHATGIGGPVAAFLLIGGWSALPLFGLVGLVGWARVYLKAHTPGQIIAGNLLGFSGTLTLLSLFGVLL